MPRSIRSNGRPGTAVIPDGWAASHAPVVEKLMLEATVSIRQAGSSGTHWDEDAGATVPTPYAPFASDVPARILALAEATNAVGADAVDQQVRVIGYRLALPRATADTRLVPGVLIDVTTCTGDPLLVGRQMTVTDVVRGTHIFEREVFALLND
jgi:hypothetical protein